MIPSAQLLGELTSRRATRADLPALLTLIADDALGKNRDADHDHPIYAAAFERIDADPNQYLMVVARLDEVVGMAQITLIPGLSRRGATRANIEAVRVASGLRGQGVGTWLMLEAQKYAQSQGCALLQLTSDKVRDQAHRFYGELGYEASHIGFKRRLEII